MKEFNFEIYTCNEETGETGWEIHFVSVIAENKKDALTELQNYPNFDCVILLNYETEFTSHKDIIEKEKYHLTIEENKFYRTNVFPIDANYEDIVLNPHYANTNRYCIDLKYEAGSYRTVTDIYVIDGKITVLFPDTLEKEFMQDKQYIIDNAIEEIKRK